jgi:hypothetical protein
MKKLLVWGAVLIALLITLVITKYTIALSPVGEIVFIEGNVQVQDAIIKTWKKAELGTPLNIGDSIRTARRSKADIVVDKENKHTVRVEEQTLVVLNSTSPGLINKIDLSNGKVFADVEKMKEGMTFEISTPSSTAGVRGSGMGVESNRDRDEFAAFKDNVYLKSYDQQNNLISESTIPEGFKAGADRFEGPGEITQLTDRDRADWNALKEDIGQRAEGGTKATDDNTALMDSVQEVVETGSLDDAKDVIEEQGVDEQVDERCIEEEHECES